MLDWLIIGGGPHGVHLAIRLIDLGVPVDQIAILDPNPKPLARWNHHTSNAGMSHLRSPEVHNLGVSPFSLGEHAHSFAYESDKQSHSPDQPDFIPPYSRPSLRLFRHHVQTLVAENGLLKRWKVGQAESLQAVGSGYGVRTDRGENIGAKHVVLAIGVGNQPALPSWAREFKSQHEDAPVFHLFSPEFKREEIRPGDDVIIVGAGISAAQLALSLSKRNSDREITMVSRHFLKKEDFDSDPGWLGPTMLDTFRFEKDYAKRRAMIQEARNKGSLASEVMHDLQDAIQNQRTICLEMAEVEGISFSWQGDRLELSHRPFELDEDEYARTGEIAHRLGKEVQRLRADVVVLATGFKAKRPGGALVDETIKTMNLPTAGDGFPIVDSDLRWRTGLFVMGALAELEVGPVSRNISGAQIAAEKIIKSAEARSSVRNTGALARYSYARVTP